MYKVIICLSISFFGFSLFSCKGTKGPDPKVATVYPFAPIADKDVTFVTSDENPGAEGEEKEPPGDPVLEIPQEIQVLNSGSKSTKIIISWKKQDIQNNKNIRYLIHRSTVGGHKGRQNEKKIEVSLTPKLKNGKLEYENNILNKNSHHVNYHRLPLRKYSYKISAYEKDSNKVSRKSSATLAYLVPADSVVAFYDIYKNLEKADQELQKGLLIYDKNQPILNSVHEASRVVKTYSTDDTYTLQFSNYSPFGSIDITGTVIGKRNSKKNEMRLKGSLDITGIYTAKISFDKALYSIENKDVSGSVSMKYDGKEQKLLIEKIEY